MIMVSIAGEQVDQLSSPELGAWRPEHRGTCFSITIVFGAHNAGERRTSSVTDKSLEEGAKAACCHSIVDGGVAHRIRHYPKQLSGGEQQRVGIASDLERK
jgi:putative ABC transport system ATP-binding protein